MSVVDLPRRDSPRLKRRRLRVGIIAADRTWRTDLVSYVTEHVGALHVTVVRDPVLLDLGGFDTVVIDDTVPFVDGILSKLAAADVAVVAIHEPTGNGHTALTQSGVRPDHLLDAGTDVAVVVEAILDSGGDVGVEAIDDRRLVRATSADSTTAPQAAVISNLVTVVGIDAVTGCELAGGLAHGFSRTVQTLLVDLGRPPIATTRFGLQLQPNLADAARALGHDADADIVKFTAWRGVSNVQLPFWTLTGAPDRAERRHGSNVAPVLSPVEADAILDRAGSIFPVQIALAGSSPVDEVAAVAVERAAHVIVACEPTPSGVAQLLAWVAQMSATDDLTSDPSNEANDACVPRLRRPIEVVLVGSAGRSARAHAVTELVDALGERLVDVPRFIALGDRPRRRASWRADVPTGRFKMSCRRFAKDLLTDAEVGRDLFEPEFLGIEPDEDDDADGEDVVDADDTDAADTDTDTDTDTEDGVAIGDVGDGDLDDVGADVPEPEAVAQ